MSSTPVEHACDYLMIINLRVIDLQISDTDHMTLLADIRLAVSHRGEVVLSWDLSCELPVLF